MASLIHIFPFSGTNLTAGVPGLQAAVNPYQAYNLASVGGVDWSSLGYSLPAPAMYATL